MLILVDQDGVLADFAAGFDTAWAQVRAEHPDAPWFPSDQSTSFYLRDQYPQAWHEHINRIQWAPGFFRNLPPMPGAVEAMHELLAAGHDVRICTAPLTQYENCVLEKHQWIAEHLGREWVKRVILTKDKTLVRGDVLIDDKPTVTGVLTPTWTHVLYDAPYNRTIDTPRITWGRHHEVLDTIGARLLATV